MCAQSRELPQTPSLLFPCWAQNKRTCTPSPVLLEYSEAPRAPPRADKNNRLTRRGMGVGVMVLKTV